MKLTKSQVVIVKEVLSRLEGNLITDRRARMHVAELLEVIDAMTGGSTIEPEPEPEPELELEELEELEPLPDPSPEDDDESEVPSYDG